MLWLAIVDHRLAVVPQVALSAVMAGRCDVSAVLRLAIVDHRLAVVARAALSAVVAGRCDVSAVLRFGLLVRFYGLVCSVLG